MLISELSITYNLFLTYKALFFAKKHQKTGFIILIPAFHFIPYGATNISPLRGLPQSPSDDIFVALDVNQGICIF